MSKITNDDLTRSGTGCFIVYGNSGRQRVNVPFLAACTFTLTVSGLAFVVS